MPMNTDAVDLDRPPRSALERPLEHAEDREPVALELAGVFLALFGLLLALSIVTLAPEGSPRSLANVAGAGGRSVAHAVTLALGLGAYVLAAFPVAWGITCLHGRLPRVFGRKVLLAPAVAAFVAILAALLFRKLSIPGLWQSGPGGYVGKAVAAVLFKLVGKGAGLLAFGLLAASLLLTTDLRIGALLGKKKPKRAARKARPAAEAGAEADAEAGGVAVAEEGDDVEGVSAPRFEGVEDDDAYEDEGHGSFDDAGAGGERLLGRDDDDLDLADASEVDLDRALRQATADEEPAAPAPAPEPRVKRPPPPRRTGA